MPGHTLGLWNPNLDLNFRTSAIIHQDNRNINPADTQNDTQTTARRQPVGALRPLRRLQDSLALTFVAPDELPIPPNPESPPQE